MSDDSAIIRFDRRHFLALGAGTAVAAKMGVARAADGNRQTHGISAFGDLKYPADFLQFDYVNPKAPKGGYFSSLPLNGGYNGDPNTFNTLNAFVLKGQGAEGMGLTFASLMARAGDEPDAMYGLAASQVTISADGSNYKFLLRPEAKFHDGTKLTSQDVVFSLKTLKEKGHPTITQQLRDVAAIEAPDERTVSVTFTASRARDVPLLVAGLPIFSKAYYTGKPFGESTLEIPLGCGPYRIEKFEAGRFIEYSRVRDWWGADLPVTRGLYNFDTVRFEYFRDRDAAFQGFTGRSYLFREEFTSRVWNTSYDFPALKDGRVKRELTPDETPSGAQGWFINTRRDKFKDARVREALIVAFDFEWVNKSIMYDAYARTHSPFQNSDLMAADQPSADELTLLEPFRDKLSDEVFAAPFTPPASDGSGRDRNLRRRASQLLDAAGYAIKDGKRRMPNGELFAIEFLLFEPTFLPHHNLYVQSLDGLGITSSLRMVESSQYQLRINEFDFDLTVKRFSMASTPGESMRTFFSSQAAAIKGSQNVAGIADPVLDKLIDRIIGAGSRDELRTACRAFDRVFRAGRYWIPQWYLNSHRLAYWDVFGRPATLPKYLGTGAPDLWWSTQIAAPPTEQAK